MIVRKLCLQVSQLFSPMPQKGQVQRVNVGTSMATVQCTSTCMYFEKEPAGYSSDAGLLLTPRQSGFRNGGQKKKRRNVGDLRRSTRELLHSLRMPKRHEAPANRFRDIYRQVPAEYMVIVVI